jgi:hypothetical protein
MKSILILSVCFFGLTGFAKTAGKADRKPSSVESKCVANLEAIAKKVSSLTGATKLASDMVAHPSEAEGSSVVVYIGPRVSFDRYEFTLANADACTIASFSVTKAGQ